jgi:hypothetical protein
MNNKDVFVIMFCFCVWCGGISYATFKAGQEDMANRMLKAMKTNNPKLITDALK